MYMHPKSCDHLPVGDPACHPVHTRSRKDYEEICSSLVVLAGGTIEGLLIPLACDDITGQYAAICTEKILKKSLVPNQDAADFHLAGLQQVLFGRERRLQR